VGKTALAIQIAHDPEIRAHFYGGILWAALGTDPNMLGLLSRWGKLLGISSTEMASLRDSEDWVQALHSAIRTRSMLLIIDDSWRVEDVLSLKVGGPNCAYLVTTRLPHVAIAVAADGATVLHELGEDEGITLLRRLAPGVIDREEQQKARILVHAVGGLPLALTLIGNYLRIHAYSGQARRIDTAFARLSNAVERVQIGVQQSPIERHPSLPASASLSLQSVFAISEQQLDEQARAALYALSVFPAKPNSFSEEAALAVAMCPVETLDTLFDAGLLESSMSGRYTLHQTIADYARLHLKGNAAYGRLIAHCTTFTEELTKDYEVLEQESAIILAALETAYQLGMWEQLVCCACAFAPFLLVRGMYTVAEQHMQRAYEAAKVLGDSAVTATSLLYLGEIAQYQGKYERAEICYREGLTLARAMNDLKRISALLNDLGWMTWKQGNYSLSETYLQEGLIIARQIGDYERISGLLKVLGAVAASKGDYIQEKAYLQEGLDIARHIGDREHLCSLLVNLGVTAGEQGDYIQAEASFQEGLALARQIEHRELMSVLLANLGEALMTKGDYIQAEASFQEGLALARQIGNREWTCVLLSNLGILARKQGKYEKAGMYLQESLTIAQELSVPQIIANVLYEMGDFCLEQLQVEKAESIFREMLTTLREGDQDLIALAQFGLAQVAAARGDVLQARRLAETSLGALRTREHRNASEVQDWLDTL
jgi:tetratricopeptide (TPR) repeat protein